MHKQWEYMGNYIMGIQIYGTVFELDKVIQKGVIHRVAKKIFQGTRLPVAAKRMGVRKILVISAGKMCGRCKDPKNRHGETEYNTSRKIQGVMMEGNPPMVLGDQITIATDGSQQVWKGGGAVIVQM